MQKRNFLMTLTPISIADMILLTTTMSGNLVVFDQHISDDFDDKTSGDDCSVMGDNSAGIDTGLILIFLLVIVLLVLIRTQGQTHPSVYWPGSGGDWLNDDYCQNPEDTGMVSPLMAMHCFGLSFDIQYMYVAKSGQHFGFA